MTGDTFAGGEPDEEYFLSKNEKSQIDIGESIALMLSRDETLEGAKKDRYVFPNNMGDQFAKKVPPTLIYISEFSWYLRPAQEAADLYRRNKRLLDFCVLPGCFHNSHHNFELQKTNIWFNDFARICNTYLN